MVSEVGWNTLKPTEPPLLQLSAATNKAQAWRRWKMSWKLYKVAIQVATLLHLLGKKCGRFFKILFGLPRDIGIKLRLEKRSLTLIALR